MAELFQHKYRVPSARLQNWDYSNEAMYFITICTKDRGCSFGSISDDKMQPFQLGKIVEVEWLKTKEMRRDMNVELAEYIVMPNHFHGIVIINENRFNSTNIENSTKIIHQNSGSLTEFSKSGPQVKNLSSIIRGFKSSVTSYAIKNEIPFEWQPRFHDHIIRGLDEYQRIAAYISENPAYWRKDKFYK